MENLFEEFEFKTDHIHYPMHMHTGYQLIYLKKGGLSFSIGTERFTTHAACFIFFNNTEPHAIHVLEGENKRYVMNINSKAAIKYVKNNILLSVFSSAGMRGRFVEVSDNINEFDLLLEMLYKDYKKPRKFSEDGLHSAFNLLLIKLYNHYPQRFEQYDTKIQSAIYGIKQFLENNPQTDCVISDFAEKYHFSDYYLLHSFKKSTGYSIKQYHMMCRIAFASELLVKSDKSITEVCFETGFSDCSSFSRYFKLKTGYTPVEYKKKFKEKK